MSYYAAITKDSDMPYWVPRDIFKEEFNRNDFLCRDSLVIKQYYLSSWFYTTKDSRYWFLIPTVHIVAGETEFINGRHRTAVLFNELDCIPMAFAEGKAQEFAKHLGLKSIQDDETFNLPTLPIVEHINCN